MRRFVIILVIIFVSNTQSQLPPSFKVCPRNSPNLANCIKEAIEHIRQNLKTGDFGSGWKIQPNEPLFIDDITIDKGRGVFINAKNIQIYRASNFNIEKVKVNMQNGMFNLDILADFRNIETTGDYKADIRFAALNVNGAGKFKVVIDELKIHIKIIMQRYMKNGEEYIKIASAPSKVLKLGKIRVNLQDLFKDKLLNEVTNAVINENPYLFVDDFTPKISNSISKNLIDSGNQLIERVPFKYILPL